MAYPQQSTGIGVPASSDHPTSPHVARPETRETEANPKFLNLHEAANYLRVDERTIRHYVKQQRLRAYRIGGRFLRFRLCDVVAQLKEEQS